MLTIEHTSKVKSICDMLNADDKGMQWTAQDNTISRSDGAEIIFSYCVSGGRERSKFAIYGMSPKEDAPYRKVISSIGVSSSKIPEAIYKDISKRLLPEYLPSYAEQKCRAIAYIEAEKAMFADMRRMQGEFGLKDEGAGVLSFGKEGVSGKAEVYGRISSRKLSVTLTGITTEQLRDVIAAVHKS